MFPEQPILALSFRMFGAMLGAMYGAIFGGNVWLVGCHTLLLCFIYKNTTNLSILAIKSKLYIKKKQY